MKNENKELVAKETGYISENLELGSMFNEEMDGMTPSFERVKIPSGGSVAFEMPGEDPDSPDMVKEFSGVIVYHHPINVFYKDKFDGASNPPDCGSMDGKFGIEFETGQILECKTCQKCQFGSSEDGRGKACKQKRRLYVLRAGEILPIILTLPTGSLNEFSNYIMRLLNKGRKSNTVVTKFSLKKAQNAGGITYSQGVFNIERDLTAEEKANIFKISEQIKQLATHVSTDAE